MEVWVIKEPAYCFFLRRLAPPTDEFRIAFLLGRDDRCPRILKNLTQLDGTII
jgi:hypothetical protein